MHFAGTSSAEAFQLYIYIAWNLKTLSYSDKKCHNISKGIIWYHKLSKPYLNGFLTNIFWKHFFKKSLQYFENEQLNALNWLRTSFMDINLIFRHILTNTFLKNIFIDYFFCNTLKMNHWIFWNWLRTSFMDINLIFLHILTNTFLKKYLLFFSQYLENEPLNVLKLIADLIYG